MQKLFVNHFWELTGWDLGREGWVLCFSGSYLLHWCSLVVPVSQPVNTPALLHFLLSLQGWGHHWTHLLLPLHLPLRSSGESWSWYGQTGVRLNINKIIEAPVDPEGVINAPKSVTYVLSIFFLSIQRTNFSRTPKCAVGKRFIHRSLFVWKHWNLS